VSTEAGEVHDAAEAELFIALRQGLSIPDADLATANGGSS
jgi:hypothetical protein